MTAASVPAERLRRIEQAIETVPYAQLLGIELDKVIPGEAILTLVVRPELTQNHGVVHGGAIASLLDTATAFAILTLLEPEERVTTVDLAISYLRPAVAGKLIASARVLRKGRRLIATTAEVADESGTLVATALSTYIQL